MTSLLALALTCALPLASIAADLTASTPQSSAIKDGSWEDVLAQDGMVSPWLKQVCKLLEAGTEEGVVLAFIDSAGTFSLNWKQIVRLRELGVPNDMVAAMLSHDTQLSAGLLPPPAPPSGPVMPRKLILTNSLSITPIRQSPSQEESIVNPSPAPELVSFSAEAERTGILDLTLSDLFPGVFEIDYGSPVREPYPVPLTSPIRVYRGVYRAPNMQVLHWFR